MLHAYGFGWKGWGKRADYGWTSARTPPVQGVLVFHPSCPLMCGAQKIHISWWGVMAPAYGTFALFTVCGVGATCIRLIKCRLCQYFNEEDVTCLPVSDLLALPAIFASCVTTRWTSFDVSGSTSILTLPSASRLPPPSLFAPPPHPPFFLQPAS